MNHVTLLNENWHNIFVRVPEGKSARRAEFVLEGANFRLVGANFFPSRGKFSHPFHYIGTDWIASFCRFSLIEFRPEPDTVGSRLHIRGNVERAEEELMHAYLKFS